MTLYKRIGSLILSLLLVFSMFGSTFAIQTFAATSPALSAESKTVNAGEQFTVAVSLANAASVYGGNFTLQYDSSLLTVNSYTFGSIVSGHTKNCNTNYQSAGNLIRVTFSGASAVSASGTLITFTFTAKENVSGSAALQFNAYKMYDENGSAITSTATGSAVTIATGPVASPTISVSNKTITVGETISVPITISNSDAVYGGNFTLQYDSNLLSADSYSFGGIVSGHTKNCNLDYQSAGNLIRVTFSGADAVSSDGTLITLTFTAKSAGTATLKFNAYKMYNENGSSIDTTATGGNVIITGTPVPPTPVSLSVSTKPTKTAYEIGESLNTSGLKLKLTYSDGSTETITSGFTTSGFSSATAGTKTVTVKYNGLTTTFTVTVKNVTVYDAYVYTEAKKTVVQGSQFTYTVSLAGTYDGFSFEIASGNGLTVTNIITTNSNINIDKIGDKWMVSVLGGLAKTDAEKEELVTVTVQVASDAELGARTLTLSNLMLSNESGDKVSAIKYEYASIEITDQIPGDINGDGTFDYYDVSKLYAYYRNKTTLSESVDTDVNGDGGFDYYDVSKLYAIYRGKANFN